MIRKMVDFVDLIIHPNPDHSRARQSLVQPSIDLGPTLLEFFGHQPSSDMTGKPLGQTIADDTTVRDAAIFGMHGHHVNVTDGRYAYMRGPASAENQPLANYTLMPTHMQHTFAVDELRDNIELAGPFGFTKDCRTMKIACHAGMPGGEDAQLRLPTLLFDVQNDPTEQSPIQDPDVERRMIEQMIRLMQQCDAPQEQYQRLGLQAGSC